MMNKKIMYMAGVVLASLSLGAMTAQTVNAASTNPIRQGKKLNLTRKATIFNRKGEKVGHLKKGRVYKILGIKSINGNNFVKIGKNKFVKEGHFYHTLRTQPRQLTALSIHHMFMIKMVSQFQVSLLNKALKLKSWP